MRIPASFIDVVFGVLVAAFGILFWPAQKLSVAVRGNPPLPGVTSVSEEAPAEFRWSQLEDSDLKRYAANLRAVGCPAGTVHHIILAVLDRGLTRQFSASLREPAREYWESPTPILLRDRRRQRAIIQFRHERERLSQEILGKMPGAPPGEEFQEQRPVDLSFLSADRARDMRGLLEKFARAERELAEEKILNGSSAMLEDRSKKLTAERRAEIRSLLGSDELFQYDLRTSDMARFLRETLYSFTPTESEFQKIFLLQTRLVEDLAAAGTNGARLRAAALARFQSDSSQELGPERFVQYQLARTSRDYRALFAVVQSRGLAADLIPLGADILGRHEEKMAKIRADPSLDAGARVRAGTSLRNDLDAQWQAVLGEEFMNFKRRRSETGWAKPLTLESK
jgi:hypothetical protein